MDATRFDTLAKRLVTPTTRRATLGAATAGALLRALGLDRSVPETRAVQGSTCTLAFAATVRLGPSFGKALGPTGSRPGEIRGELRFALSETGTLEDAALHLPEGTTLPVVGQATGYTLQVRIELEPRVALVAVGVGERAIADCTGAIDGMVTGPQVGDLGDWHAAAGQGSSRQRGGSQGAAASTQEESGRSNRSRRANRDGATGATEPTPTSGSGGAACARGLTRCGRDCVDLQVDPNHCGTCDTVCESGLVAVACRSGVCERADCPVGQEYCGAADGCRDLATDPDHCGACGRGCGEGEACAGGACTARGNTPAADSPCASGLTDCGGVCVDLLTDAVNCGTCGLECAYGQRCGGGACTSICAAALSYCNDVCVDHQTDAANCGGCGALFACTSLQVCQGGACISTIDQPLTCEALGLTDCGGTCADLLSDPAHCGGCGLPCSGGCVSGVCIEEAPAPDVVLTTCESQGLTDCGGVCVNLTNDAANCGACGWACAPLEICAIGDCQLLCTGAFEPCDSGGQCCSGTCLGDPVTGTGVCG